eukprot:g56943.t1
MHVSGFSVWPKKVAEEPNMVKEHGFMDARNTAASRFVQKQPTPCRYQPLAKATASLNSSWTHKNELRLLRALAKAGQYRKYPVAQTDCS